MNRWCALPATALLFAVSCPLAHAAPYRVAAGHPRAEFHPPRTFDAVGQTEQRYYAHPRSFTIANVDAVLELDALRWRAWGRRSTTGRGRGAWTGDPNNADERGAITVRLRRLRWAPCESRRGYAVRVYTRMYIALRIEGRPPTRYSVPMPPSIYC